jgi:MFS transporter, SP family, arabinose:H+ symporter
MLKGRFADTKKALGILGIDVSEEQVRTTAQDLVAGEREQQQQGKSLWTRGVKRALIVVGVFFIFQQITGINIPFYYGPELLGKFFQGASTGTVSAAVAGVEVATILGLVNVIATYFGFRWIDKVGRRPLAMYGFAGMAAFMLVASAGVAFLTGAPKIVVVMIGLSFFISSFAIGVGGTGWIIQGEVFPTAVRGRAAAIGASVDWLANFAIIEMFPTMNTRFGLAWVMVGFAVLAVIAITFVARYLPETKGLSVEEVTRVFEKEAA